MLTVKQPLIVDNKIYIGFFSKLLKNDNVLSKFIDHYEYNMSRFFGKKGFCSQYPIVRDKIPRLTKRQTEVVSLLIKGYTAKGIATILSSPTKEISFKTVESHICNSKIRLGCSTRDQLLDYINVHNFFNMIPENLFDHYLSCDINE